MALVLLIGLAFGAAAILIAALWLRRNGGDGGYRDPILEAEWQGMQARQRIIAATLAAYLLMEEVAERARRESSWWRYR